MRTISHSEASTALDCQARHAFAYTGQLTNGDALKPKTTHVLLRQGRAWGAAVAALHEMGAEHARVALTAHLSLASAEQIQAGLFDEAAHRELVTHLNDLLEHYIQTAEPLPINRLEHEIQVAAPARSGTRASTRYRYQAFFDGAHIDSAGRTWIVEFKLRKQLSSLEQIVLSRQTRWYAWAYQATTGKQVAGVVVDERLNQAPSPVKVNKDGTPSKVQSCRLDDYIAAWQELGREPDEEIVAKLAARQWHSRHVVIFRPGELQEAGLQIASAANLINQLDTGALFPVRNPSRMRCPGCAYRDICPNPGDTVLVDALFNRVPAKRDKEETRSGTTTIAA